MATAFSAGQKADFALLKESRTAVDASIVMLADSGYQGLDKLYANSRTPKKRTKRHNLTRQEKASNRAIASQRIGCEHSIRRLKVFKILSERYRNRRKRFALRFNLIAAICNRDLRG